MELKRKKELLLLADSIAKDINNQGCGNYVPKILNSISIAKKKYYWYDNEEWKNM